MQYVVANFRLWVQPLFCGSLMTSVSGFLCLRSKSLPKFADHWNFQSDSNMEGMGASLHHGAWILPPERDGIAFIWSVPLRPYSMSAHVLRRDFGTA